MAKYLVKLFFPLVKHLPQKQKKLKNINQLVLKGYKLSGKANRFSNSFTKSPIWKPSTNV